VETILSASLELSETCLANPRDFPLTTKQRRAILHPQSTSNFANKRKLSVRNTLLTSLTILSLSLSSVISVAKADQITIGNSSPDIWDIAGTGNSDPLAISSSGSFLTEALFDSDLGVADFGPVSMDTSAGTNGVFPVVAQIPPGETLSVSFPDGDELSGSITWTSLDNGSFNPHATGELNYTSSGDSAFLNSFGSSGSAEIDLLFDKTPQTLENWNTDAGVTLSSGEIVANTVAEPSALILLGSALVALGLFLRRKTKPSFRYNIGL